MTQKVLAKIGSNRSITFTEDAQIHVHWDAQTFAFDYHTFSDLIRTLQDGTHCDYTDCATCCFVRIDEENQEVWIQGTCLLLARREFRALLNAALSTQTRLYGIMRSLPKPVDPLAHIEMRAVGPMGRPPCRRHSLN